MSSIFVYLTDQIKHVNRHTFSIDYYLVPIQPLTKTQYLLNIYSTLYCFKHPLDSILC